MPDFVCEIFTGYHRNVTENVCSRFILCAYLLTCALVRSVESAGANEALNKFSEYRATIEQQRQQVGTGRLLALLVQRSAEATAAAAPDTEQLPAVANAALAAGALPQIINYRAERHSGRVADEEQLRIVLELSMECSFILLCQVTFLLRHLAEGYAIIEPKT